MKLQSAIGFALLACGLAGSCLGAEGQKAVVIHAGQLFDGKSDRLLSNQVIVIQGDRISDVGPAGSVKAPAGAEEIDLGKATVLPGLIDGHSHVFKWMSSKYSVQMLQTNSWQYRTIEALLNAKKDLEAGFTTMRDCGSMGAMYSDTDLRRAINEGLVPGPRLQVATLPLIGSIGMPAERGFSPGMTVPSMHRVVDSPWEGRKAVREEIKYGADFIKLFPGNHGSSGVLGIQPTMTLEEEKAIVDEAHREGVKAACHTAGGVTLRDSIEVGCDSIELGIDIDPESIGRMAEKGIFLVTDLSNKKSWEPAELKATQGKWSQAPIQKASYQRALKAGVKIAFGANAGSGAEDHGAQAKEFEYMVDYGMKPAQALRAATAVAAELMGWQDQVGTVEKGKYADVIAVAGNPLGDITELERVKFVMKGGAIVRNDLK
jgi:imidazolonepropionase-like amidohydrolase